jgi:GR25 family glycosyltransferase involved in LPS biosynthesis
MYHIFDSVFCINLKERKDRHKQSKQLFDRLNIPVEFYFAEKQKSGKFGCFDSHINVIKKSYHRGDEHVLIFEDDIVETPSFNETIMKEISAYLKKSKCEYFQLGYSILDMEEIVSYFTAKREQSILNYNGLTTHAYCLNRKGMKKVIEQYENFINDFHVDVFYKKIFDGACACPLLFQQNFCIKSDNNEAENMYFFILRKLSCFQYKLSIFYLFSLIKKYSIIVCLLLLFILFNIMKKYE